LARLHLGLAHMFEAIHRLLYSAILPSDPTKKVGGRNLLETSETFT